jgi:serine/threonine-protein kinase
MNNGREHDSDLLNVGETFADAFTIKGKSRYGSHAWLYPAEPINEPGSIVALKILKKSNQPEELIDFRKEAEIESCLEHPNIARCYSKEPENGNVKGTEYYYIRKEFIEGDNLKVKINGKRLPTDIVLSYGIKIAQGLEHAKVKRVLHRDLKCENILIAPGDAVKIIDFGQAAIITGEDPNNTDNKIIYGSAGYADPVQYSAKPLDHRCDIWGLGLILYEMLTGQPAFTGGYAERIRKSIEANPLPFALYRGLTVPPLLEQLIFRMIAKKATERPQNVSDVRISLLAVLEHLERQENRELKEDNPELRQEDDLVGDPGTPEAEVGKPEKRLMDGVKRLVELTNKVK